jgi:hypothetical protein
MPEVDDLEMESRVEEILNRRPAIGLAVGVVRDGRLEFFHGHGLADIASDTPVTEDTVFRIGSITKTVTAIAVMQLWDDSDPYVSRVDLSDVGIGTSRVVFSRAPGAEATSLHLGFVPLSFDRQPAISNPRPWGAAALAALAVATTTRAVRRRGRLNKGAST